MDRIKLSQKRLSTSPYTIDTVFQPASYDWQGDWEGRALLAFCCHYEIDGTKIPCMDQFMAEVRSHLNEKLYFGKVYDGVTVDEQQLSGHNWFLRGLIKYAELFGSTEAEQIAKSIFENLYYPALDHFYHYPLTQRRIGDVSGTIVADGDDGWRLSSDVGCGLMSSDGVSEYYRYTHDSRAKLWLETVFGIFASANKYNSGFQTHSTLSTTRAMLRMYNITKEERYLGLVKDTLRMYCTRAMTLTYENYNWLNNPNTWTEPCAVVDSFILATELYYLTGEQDYLTLARRIWFNGLDFCQRSNGGAGPDTCVTPEQPILKVKMYEAPFCCTMRYAEGLLEYSKNKDLFEWDCSAPETTDEYGRHFVDDKLIVMYKGEKVPIFSCRDYSEEEAEKIELRVIY